MTAFLDSLKLDAQAVAMLAILAAIFLGISAVTHLDPERMMIGSAMFLACRAYIASSKRHPELAP